MIRVALSMPLYANGLINQAAASAFYGYCLAPDQGIEVATRLHSHTSAAQLAYDTTWAAAINLYNEGEITHFCRLDCDVVPTHHNWLGVLIGELKKHDADIMSAVVPLKDERGFTSTSVDDTGDKWNPRIITMTEVMDRPETFTDPRILVNTGLYVVDLSKPWVHAMNEDGSLACSHHMRNKIVQGASGRWEPRMRSEDWELSRDMRKIGATRQYATRKVHLFHEQPQYRNWEAWGTCQNDPQHSPSESECDLACTHGATTAAV